MVSSDHYDPPAGLSRTVADLVHRHRSAAAQPQGGHSKVYCADGQSGQFVSVVRRIRLHSGRQLELFSATIECRYRHNRQEALARQGGRPDVSWIANISSAYLTVRLLLAIRNLMHWAVNERLIEANGNRQARRSVQRHSASNGGGRITHPPNDHR